MLQKRKTHPAVMPVIEVEEEEEEEDKKNLNFFSLKKISIILSSESR